MEVDARVDISKKLMEEPEENLTGESTDVRFSRFFSERKLARFTFVESTKKSVSKFRCEICNFEAPNQSFLEMHFNKKHKGKFHTLFMKKKEKKVIRSTLIFFICLFRILIENHV